MITSGLRTRSAGAAAAGLLLLLTLLPAAPVGAADGSASTRPSRARDGDAAIATTDRPLSTEDDATPVTRPGSLESEPIRRKATAAGAKGSGATTRSTAGARPSSKGLELPRVALALGVVLALIFLFRAFGRRLFPAAGAAPGSRAVTLLSRTPISPKQHVLLLQVGRRIIVTADCGGQMSSLGQIDDPDEIAALVGRVLEEKGAASANSFVGLLSRKRSGYEADVDEAEGDREQRSTPQMALTGDDNGDEPAEMSSTRSELRGLMDRVRLLSKQFKAS